MIPRMLAAFIVIGAMLGASACGGGGSSDDDGDFLFDAEVLDIDFDDDTITVGDGTIARIQFVFDFDDVFDDGDSVFIVIRLPAELEFRPGTGEIQSEVGSDDDVGADVFNCETGEQFVQFEVDEDELFDAEDPSGDADAELTLTLDGIAPGQAAVRAAARIGPVPFTCGQPFGADEEQVLSVS